MALMNRNVSYSDDEEDLESLRLAALQSLKPKLMNFIDTKPSEINPVPQYGYKQSFGAAQTTRNHNRGFRNNSGRPGRNGLSSRVRTNTNLISIQTIDQNETNECKKEVVIEVPKLTLPQDRYCKSASNLPATTQKESRGNKFDRYDNSDDSESDVEEVTKPVRRERKDSLEQLMSALENEINGLENKSTSGEEKLTEKLKIENKNIPQKPVVEEIDAPDDTLIILESKPDLDLEKICPMEEEEIIQPQTTTNRPPVRQEYSKSREHSPYIPERRGKKSRTRSPQYKSPYRSPRRSRSPVWKPRYSPGHYPRPLSPLALNAEVLNTITMAPLSPRSAAFVLENRQILARRKMSPRRSLSRGSSRSITPKRSKNSPRRRSRSRPISPRKRSKSRSPKQKSMSPRNQRRAPSYKLNRLPPSGHSTKRHSDSPLPKHSVHKRLGSRPTSRTATPQPDDRKLENKHRRISRSMSLSLSPSPDRNYAKKPLNENIGHVNNDSKRTRERNRRESPKPRLIPQTKHEEKPVDPVLEARKRKFESGQVETNGIIKLKTNKISNEDNESKIITPEAEPKLDLDESDDEFAEELEDGVIDLNPSLDDLWTEEESDSGNEGRFKSKPTTEKRVTTLPFTKLMSKPNPGTAQLPKEDTQNHRKTRRPRNYSRRRSRSPLRSNTNRPEKSSAKPGESAPAPKQVADKLEETKKIIPDKEEPRKVKLPAETDEQNTENLKVAKVTEVDRDIPRRVKLARKPDVLKPLKLASEEKFEVVDEVTVQQEDDTSVTKSDDGDLRAELSRRRAERLKAGSLAEAVPTRLLKNALEEAVPKRLATNKPSKGNGSSADRRVLVLKRLASSCASELDPANKVPVPEGKLPIHMRLGVSSGVDVAPDENVRIERRTKRSRSGRRRKGAAVQPRVWATSA